VGNCNWKKTGLWFSPVQSYVYFQSCRLDLRTLDIGDVKVRMKNVDEKCNFDDLDKTYGGSRVLAPGKL